MLFRSFLAAAFVAILSTAAGATTLTFSNVTYTSNSVTFTINGSMSGYVDKQAYKNKNWNEFSIQFGGDLAPNSRKVDLGANSWSTAVFDNVNVSDAGHSGAWRGLPYAWSEYAGSLATAVATNRTVTLTLPSNYLDMDAHNPRITFLWGDGESYTHPVTLATVIATPYVAPQVTSSPVPLPAALPLLGTVLLGGLGLSRVRRKG